MEVLRAWWLVLPAARARHRLDRHRGDAGVRRALRPAVRMRGPGAFDRAGGCVMAEPTRIAAGAARGASMSMPACSRSALAGTLVVLLIGSLLVVVDLSRHRRGPAAARPGAALSATRSCRPIPRADMRRFVAGEMARAEQRGWIDQAQGVAHIPIDDAMRRVAA